ncbi:hypothetical protein KY342_01895 [Candidatus Woesearchaeota archaeon]|nr:hypothetical protein [Candidatus Woesearchaeota archaeon]
MPKKTFLLGILILLILGFCVPISFAEFNPRITELSIKSRPWENTFALYAQGFGDPTKYPTDPEGVKHPFNIIVNDNDIRLIAMVSQIPNYPKDTISFDPNLDSKQYEPLCDAIVDGENYLILYDSLRRGVKIKFNAEKISTKPCKININQVDYINEIVDVPLIEIRIGDYLVSGDYIPIYAVGTKPHQKFGIFLNDEKIGEKTSDSEGNLFSYVEIKQEYKIFDGELNIISLISTDWKLKKSIYIYSKKETYPSLIFLNKQGLYDGKILILGQHYEPDKEYKIKFKKWFLTQSRKVKTDGQGRFYIETTIPWLINLISSKDLYIGIEKSFYQYRLK